MADCGLNDILQTEIRVILKIEIKDAYDQTPKEMDEIILLKGNGKGASGTPNSEMYKRKEDMSMTTDIEGNCELSEETFQVN